MARELLKFRPGDCGLKIMKDGQMEVAGVNEESPMIDTQGKVNPALLFAAAWARKDQKVFEALVQNFKDAVFEGFFGPEAQTDYQKALKVQEEHTKNMQEKNVAVKKPMAIDHDLIGNEFETHSDKPTVSVATSGATTFEQPKPGVTTWPGQDTASGAVTFEQPKPYDKNDMLKGRDS